MKKDNISLWLLLLLLLFLFIMMKKQTPKTIAEDSVTPTTITSSSIPSPSDYEDNCDASGLE